MQVTIGYKIGSSGPNNTTISKSYTLKGISSQFAVAGVSSVGQCDTRNIQIGAASYGDADLFNWTVTDANIIGSSTGSMITIYPTSNFASISAVCTARMSTAPAACSKTFTKYIDRTPPTTSIVQTAPSNASGLLQICPNTNATYKAAVPAAFTVGANA